MAPVLESGGFWVGDDRVRYCRQRGRFWFWEPGAFGVKYGVASSVPLGSDATQAKAEAIRLNEKLDLARKGLDKAKPRYAEGTFGRFFEGYFRHSEAWRMMEMRTIEDYERTWPEIEKRFASKLVSQITPDASERFHTEIHPAHNPKSEFSWNEAHRILKVWRALLSALVAYRIVAAPAPIGRVANPAPVGREGLWLGDEVVGGLAPAAAFIGLTGLAVAIRIAWDAMLSPVDARTVPLCGWRDGCIAWRREKTGKRILHAVTPETKAIVNAYVAHCEARGAKLHPDAPLIRRPNGKAYTDKDSFGDDFRLVRNAIFPGDARQFLDLRRSAATEARLGGATRDDIGKAMANSVDKSEALFDTYILAASERVLAARALGQERMAAKFRNGAGQ